MDAEEEEAEDEDESEEGRPAPPSPMTKAIMEMPNSPQIGCLRIFMRTMKGAFIDRAKKANKRELNFVEKLIEI